MLILASGSPRRKELLELAGFSFKVVKSDLDEEVIVESDPLEYVRKLAYSKAMDVASRYSEDTVVAADTTVFVSGTILNKPKDDNDAFRMLRYLCDKRKHYVATGVCIIHQGRAISFVEKTTVYFNNMKDEEIWDYIKTKEPLDKAGAYGIQGKGFIFVRKINGDYYNVVGLPLAKVTRILRKILKSNA